MMKYFSVLLLALLISSCSKDDKNLISKNQLGELSSQTKISELENILAEDSVVSVYAKDNFGKNIDDRVEEIEVYDTTGQQVLLLKTSTKEDSIAQIKNIRIYTERYKTAEGIGIGSTFGELKKHYNVEDIQSSLKSVIVNLEKLNAFVSFDREVLPGDIRFDLDAEIKPIMIPDDATINRFWINFEDKADDKE